jgi:hypothetical protein
MTDGRPDGHSVGISSYGGRVSHAPRAEMYGLVGRERWAQSRTWTAERGGRLPGRPEGCFVVADPVGCTDNMLAGLMWG